MRTIYGLSVTEKGEGWSGIPDRVYKAITDTFLTMEDAVNTAKNLMKNTSSILFVEVYVDRFDKSGIKRDYIERLQA